MKPFVKMIGTALALAAVLSMTGCGNAQTRKVTYLQRGREYLAVLNYDKARVEFRNAAQIDPRDATARYLLGQVAEKTGDVREAVGQYTAAIADDAKLAGARAALARLYLYAGLSDKSLELVEPGLKIEPNNAQLLTVRGAARMQLGDAVAALTDAQRAVDLAPDDDYAVAFLASIYKQQGNLSKAIEVVKAGERHLPGNADLHIIMADLLIATHQEVAAEAELRQLIVLQPSVAAHRTRLARFYVAQKQPDRAEQTLRDAVANAPASVEAKTLLVEFLAGQRGHDAAAAQADRFVAKEPDNDALKLALAGLLGQSGMTDRSEALLRAVIAHAGEKADGLTARDRLAAMLMARNDTAGATALVAQVLKLNARDNDALILRSNLLLGSGNAAAAIIDLRAVLRDQPNSQPLLRELARAYVANSEPDQAEVTLRAGLQVAPKDADTRLSLAQVLLSAKKPEQAAPLLETLAQERPGDLIVEESLFRTQAALHHNAEARATAQGIAKSRPDLALGHYLTGLIDEADDKADQAEVDYHRAIKAQPSVAEPLTELVQLDLRRKQTAKAQQEVEAVLQSTPGNASARNLKAELLAIQGDRPGAIAAYRDTVSTAPTWAQGYHGLALALLGAKRSDEATEALRQGIDKAQDPSVLVIDLATLYERTGHVPDAIAVYEKVLAKNPGASYAANNLAMMLVSHGSDSASLARAQKLADQLSSYSLVDVIDTRGWVKYQSGEYRAAVSLLQQAVDKAPDAPEVRYHLAMAQLRSGEAQPAQQNLEAAVKSTRAFDDSDNARAALAQLKHSVGSG